MASFFASLDDIDFSKWDLLLKERICSYWSKFFPLKVDPHLVRGLNEYAEVASPESVCIHLKCR